MSWGMFILVKVPLNGFLLKPSVNRNRNRNFSFICFEVLSTFICLFAFLCTATSKMSYLLIITGC